MKPFKRRFSPWLRAKPDFIAAVPPRGIWIPGTLKNLLKTSAKIFGGSTMPYHRQFFSASIYIPSCSTVIFWTWHVDTLSWWKTDICKPRQWWCLALQTSYGVPKSPAADFKGQKSNVRTWSDILAISKLRSPLPFLDQQWKYSCNDATRPWTLCNQDKSGTPHHPLA